MIRTGRRKTGDTGACCTPYILRTGFVLWLSLILLAGDSPAFGQNRLPASGESSETPEILGIMLGHISYRDAKLWVRTSKPVMLHWRFWPENQPEQARECLGYTKGEYVYLATLRAELLQPDTRYSSLLWIEGSESVGETIDFSTQPIWQFSDSLPALRIAMGSCTYVNEPGYDRPGKPYGGDYGIFEAIADRQPQVMFWLGDNTYLRDPDFSSKGGVYHRYAHTRELPEMQRLLRSTSNYAIWDDHDYGPNDSDASYAHKSWTRSAFHDFWANPDRDPYLPEAVCAAFSLADIDVILLDNRWNRSPNGAKTTEPTLLGKDQEDWLIAQLINSRAPFKLVLIGGQVLNTARVWETYSNLAPEERERLLERIDQEGIDGVIFISGDRHHSEISRLQLPGGAWVYDLTVSPLSSGSHKPSEEQNTLRIPGSLIVQRNFATMDIVGSKGRRTLNVSFFDVNGSPLFDYSIPQPGYRKE